MFEDLELYGFTLKEFEEVANNFPDVDFFDESASGCDDSALVLNNMFAFVMDRNPKDILSSGERDLVKQLWVKLNNA